MSHLSRRGLLRTLGAAAVAAPFVDLLARPRAARAASAANRAQRAIFFYFPDGVSGASQNGEPSEWHCTGSEHDFTLPSQLSPLASHKNDCIFLNGVSSGPTDSGSHPGGAKKLLTAVDGGMGQSVDQFLGEGVFRSAPWHHLFLGAASTQNGVSGDNFISYPAAGQPIAPEDNPRTAFSRLFNGQQQPSSSSSSSSSQPAGPDARTSILDVVQPDLADLRARLGNVEQQKLALHLESVREIEQRITSMPPPPPPSSSCGSPSLGAYDLADGAIYDPGRFPDVLRAQIDVAVLAMSCGITRCATLQASHHTSELIMSRFPGTEMFDAGYDMRSHQASHYGASHDPSHLEYARFVQQRRWFVSQFAYLLDQLAARADPAVAGATMLDTSVVLLCSEISDGNTHSHDNLPFIVAGRAGGAFSTGRLLQLGYERHHKLLTSIARACGADISGFGQDAGGTLPGLAI